MEPFVFKVAYTWQTLMSARAWQTQSHLWFNQSINQSVSQTAAHSHPDFLTHVHLFNLCYVTQSIRAVLLINHQLARPVSQLVWLRQSVSLTLVSRQSFIQKVNGKISASRCLPHLKNTCFQTNVTSKNLHQPQHLRCIVGSGYFILFG